MNKLFVRVNSDSVVTHSLELVIAASLSNPTKIYFMENLNYIINHGIIYGISSAYSNSINNLIELIGDDSLEEGGSSILDRLENIEAIDVATASLDYLGMAHTVSGPKLSANITTVASNSKGLADSKDVKSYVDTAAAASKSKVAVGTGLSLSTATGNDNSVTYTVSPNLTLAYHAASGNTAAYIELKSATTNDSFGTIQVSDIVGNSILKSSSYSTSTGKLSLTFAQASGTDNVVEIDLANIIDVNDVSVKNNSTNYLAISLDGTANEGNGSLAVFEIKTVNPSSATAQLTGLADAKQVNYYADGLIAGLDSTSSATGTNVTVGATLADGLLSSVSVSESYATITRTAKATGVSPDYVVTSGHGTKLVKASDLANLKSYTDDKVSDYVDSYNFWETLS